MTAICHPCAAMTTPLATSCSCGRHGKAAAELGSASCQEAAGGAEGKECELTGHPKPRDQLEEALQHQHGLPTGLTILQNCLDSHAHLIAVPSSPLVSPSFPAPLPLPCFPQLTPPVATACCSSPYTCLLTPARSTLCALTWPFTTWTLRCSPMLAMLRRVQP